MQVGKKGVRIEDAFERAVDTNTDFRKIFEDDLKEDDNDIEQEEQSEDEEEEEEDEEHLASIDRTIC